MRLPKSQRLLALVCGLSGLLFASATFAKPVNLYEQPTADAKVVGTIDSASNMVPIISNKTGDWMKVGDPQNGNVGWIRVSDVSNNTGRGAVSSGFSMSEKTVETANGPKSFRTIQFGNPESLSPEQSKALSIEIQKRQAAIQKSTMDMMQTIFSNANAFYQANPALFNNVNYPMIVPVIVVPAVAQPAGNTPAPTTKNPAIPTAPVTLPTPKKP